MKRGNSSSYILGYSSQTNFPRRPKGFVIVKEGRPLKWIIYTVVGKQGCKANKVDTIENGELFTLFYIHSHSGWDKRARQSPGTRPLIKHFFLPNRRPSQHLPPPVAPQQLASHRCMHMFWGFLQQPMLKNC